MPGARPHRPRTVAIVQARMTSTRLPGKVLASLGGRTLLDWVVRRTQRAAELDDVVVATTVNTADDPVVAECERMGIGVHRGDEHDVLGRFVGAAHAFAADVVVRITADCPLIDAAVIDEVVARFRDADVDYASNGLVSTFPRGLDVEVVRSSVLDTCAEAAHERYERAHVTPYVYGHPERFRLLSVEAPDPHGEERWTVDAPEDLELVRAIVARLGSGGNFGWRDVLRVLDAEPELRTINRAIVQKSLTEG